MLVRNFCKKCAEERFGIKGKTVCPAKEHPSWCKYGELCWVNPSHTTKEIEEDLINNYKNC